MESQKILIDLFKPGENYCTNIVAEKFLCPKNFVPGQQSRCPPAHGTLLYPLLCERLGTLNIRALLACWDGAELSTVSKILKSTRVDNSKIQRSTTATTSAIATAEAAATTTHFHGVQDFIHNFHPFVLEKHDVFLDDLLLANNPTVDG